MRYFKSIFVTMGMILCGFFCNYANAFAASEDAMHDLGNHLSLLYCIPFAGMLLSIAIAPLVMADWWEKNKQYAVLAWSLLFLIPFAVLIGKEIAFEQLMEVIFDDYITFIVLLFGLFCVAGNIHLGGKLVGKPGTNVVLLAIGTLLAGWIGTTGASMVMIRPLIRANKWRKRKVQVIIFFIFLVSNIGGCLTPVGDPPLLMGFVNGVEFTWSFRLLPILIVNMIVLLTVFYILDTRAYKKDLAHGKKQPKKDKDHPLYLSGKHNILFMVIIVGAVILNGTLPKINPEFREGIHIFGEVTFGYNALIEVVIILIAAALSFATTKKEIRESNHFTWDAIEEVAILFIGIFVTMIPALLILKAKGGQLGLTEPWQFFWVTGCLSSFLDNTPTYLVFFTTAASMGFAEGVKVSMGMIPQTILVAISCGAVFMGANTYIGNAPNFMVRSIAEENGIKMPSFFGYMAWSLGILVPVFLLDMILIMAFF